PPPPSTLLPYTTLFRSLSHLSYEWTRGQVSQETKRYLGSLPFRIDVRPLGGHVAGPRLILLHGNPVLNTVYWTEDRSDRFCMQRSEEHTSELQSRENLV